MAKVYFITEQKLKDDSIINGNVDPKIINPVILECQDFYIKMIIGSGIYNQLEAQITAGTVSALNRTLLDDYIIPCLIKYIQYEAVIYLNNKLTNANVSNKNTDESIPISLGDANAIMDRFKNKAEWYAERLTRYLITNHIDYPLFTNPGSTVDTIHPHRDNYTSGMWLGNTYPCHGCGKYDCCCRHTNMNTSSPN